MLVDGQFAVRAAPDALMRHLLDAHVMASCLPGCETLERIDNDRYKAIVVVTMAGVQARFDLLVQITRREAMAIWATTRGDEGGQASMLQADSEVRLAPSDEGTLVTYRSDVSLTGRLGRFALGMMKKKAQSLGDEFATNLRSQLETLEGTQSAPAPDAPNAAPPSPLQRLDASRPAWWQRLWAWLRGGAQSTRSRG